MERFLANLARMFRVLRRGYSRGIENDIYPDLSPNLSFTAYSPICCRGLSYSHS